ncbi:MAG TPA: arsenate reductase family protein [Polyangiaceae bacterium]|jgi:arsenate reductase|nr:arsenate reductase family protein [Polyangiaceae bacterium]
MITVYQYPRCSTCRKALRWLDAHGVKYESVDIVEAPPSRATLATVLKQSQLPVGRLFNTSGQSYREGNFKQRLPELSEAQALSALASDGKLVKRPLLLAPDRALVGFDEGAYEAAFGRRAAGSRGA